MLNSITDNAMAKNVDPHFDKDLYLINGHLRLARLPAYDLEGGLVEDAERPTKDPRYRQLVPRVDHQPQVPLGPTSAVLFGR